MAPQPQTLENNVGLADIPGQASRGIYEREPDPRADQALAPSPFERIAFYRSIST
jgi:hypothetical protein